MALSFNYSELVRKLSKEAEAAQWDESDAIETRVRSYANLITYDSGWGYDEPKEPEKRENFEGFRVLPLGP